MQYFITLIFKGFRLIYNKILIRFNHINTFRVLYTNNVTFQNFDTEGTPHIMIAKGGYCKIGVDFIMNNNLLGNPIGRPQPCTIIADKGATILIGERVGMSSTAIISHNRITIGNDVKIGGGVCIYDTDFHSLDFRLRLSAKLDKANTVTSPVSIGNNVFIGAHSTILKGVVIGENSIIGACSVVSKSIPENEIWGGNPARFIRKILYE